ncbi:hypothetical protein Lfu02_64770 [Longispora fulva]|uniref:O-antigen/teichoic acid export membrane protein n=1 Tax=Longispora fulva TaxID=619741 RepID=A0A8J7GFA1_9ACTN|nr:hypothetical protein [Longispora fulva]MBG6137739.1 O-antigen/teichoic acid export membrane protein [Longispora fulva]GIG62105.1 hypothetical protein Lfu02_64770 [Longispora fulva]
MPEVGKSATAEVPAAAALPTRTSVVARLFSPERLYMASLGLTGCAALMSVALPPADRGGLAASIVSATLGASVGSFSIDTFLLSRPHGWVLRRGLTWLSTLLAGSVLTSALVAAVLSAIAGIGSTAVGMGAAAALTVFNACTALGLRLKHFTVVYAVRSAGGVLLIAGYGTLYLIGDLDGRAWAWVWLGFQVFIALTLTLMVLRWGRGFGGAQPVPAQPGPGDRRADLAAIGKLHLGMCAQMLTMRLDQILLARVAGAGPLGVYALAVAAMEFAQAGSVVAAQRVLAHRGQENISGSGKAVLRSAAPLAVLAVIGLAGIGWLSDEYSNAWLYAVLLLPGILAVATSKIWGATLLKRTGERATTVIALIGLAAALPCFLVVIPLFDAFGAAAAVSLAYLLQAVITWRWLRRSPSTPTHGAM